MVEIQKLTDNTLFGTIVQQLSQICIQICINCRKGRYCTLKKGGEVISVRTKIKLILWGTDNTLDIHVLWYKSTKLLFLKSSSFCVSGFCLLERG